MRLCDYKTLVFDCDGVILKSNRIKTEAFWHAAKPYGSAAADALVAYHVANGGISRYAKFAYFLDELVPKYAKGTEGPELDKLLTDFASHVRAGLGTCQIAEGLDRLRKATQHARWLIVSGGDQAELRTVFQNRGLAALFDGGIFGSPDTKHAILTRELAASNIQHPALFLGDSRLDHEAAAARGLDFCFVHQWTEFKSWRQYCAKNNLPFVERLAVLL